jgi:hypothetical protein
MFACQVSLGPGWPRSSNVDGVLGLLESYQCPPPTPSIIFCVTWFILNGALLRSWNRYVTQGAVLQCQSMIALTVDRCLAVKYAINVWSLSIGTCYIDPL